MEIHFLNFFLYVCTRVTKTILLRGAKESCFRLGFIAEKRAHSQINT